jgi:hypothetical protein
MRRWLIAAALFASLPARAADHLDSPAVKVDPASDITDVYAWVSSDKTKTYLVMDVFPAATSSSKFSNAVQYVFHLTSMDAYGEKDATKIKQVNLICTFTADQLASCWVGPAVTGGISSTTDFVTGQITDKTGLTSTMGKFKLWAGLRDDPFFFNLEGFQETVKAVEAAAMKPGFASIVDASGCPHLDSTTAGALAGQLSHAAGGGAAKNFFGGLGVMAIVISIDTAVAAPGGKILGVWASTHRRPQ